MRAAALNVGSMTGKGRELADMMERKRWTYCVCKRLSGKGVRPGALEVASNCSTTAWMVEEMVCKYHSKRLC